jgi:hypothetical protein
MFKPLERLTTPEIVESKGQFQMVSFFTELLRKG